MTQPRHPKGTPAGGRFAATGRDEATGTLSDSTPVPSPYWIRLDAGPPPSSSLEWRGHGYFEASSAAVEEALARGEQWRQNRFAEIWDGDPKAETNAADFASLPSHAQAVVVADLTPGLVPESDE